ncbi:hypothetical protein [Rhizobium sp. L51/94]|uniref:hypothetical protein n=1 Tax=Rhizobium sp. L51/94 TaxID=2819999 RepID=UPI001C5B668F|nr:hypothetical protein [Rhizobium sp. L51/94]QXZ79660.1 hypothetical protein J5274_06670 [Rhizobium sp. L51/94]
MLTPEKIIADLDAFLLETGEDIVVRRVVANIKTDVACRARARGVSAKKVVGTIAATDLEVIISPTQILAAGWPGEAPQDGAADPRIPRINDYVLVKGKQRQVKFSDPIFVGNEWVRCNLVVAG